MILATDRTPPTIVKGVAQTTAVADKIFSSFMPIAQVDMQSVMDPISVIVVKTSSILLSNVLVFHSRMALPILYTDKGIATGAIILVALSTFWAAFADTFLHSLR